MGVLRPVVHHQQHARGRKALDQAVEEGLRLAVQPVEVFEDYEERLHLALAQEQALERVERAAPALARLRFLLGLVRGHVEEPEEDWNGGAQGVVERQDLARDLLADAPLVVVILDAEVGLEHLADG